MFMHILPRKYPNLLLASVVWLASCAGLWWALPTVARGELRLPRDRDLVAVLPGGEHGVVAIHISGEFGQEYLADFELVELPSGRAIRKLQNCVVPIDRFTRWKNCGSIVVREGPREDEKWRRLNLSSFALTEISTESSI
jgi:hypothetical protein